jgi:hypothetical protein
MILHVNIIVQVDVEIAFRERNEVFVGEKVHAPSAGRRKLEQTDTHILSEKGCRNPTVAVVLLNQTKRW